MGSSLMLDRNTKLSGHHYKERRKNHEMTTFSLRLGASQVCQQSSIEYENQ